MSEYEYAFVRHAVGDLTFWGQLRQGCGKDAKQFAKMKKVIVAKVAPESCDFFLNNEKLRKKVASIFGKGLFMNPRFTFCTHSGIR